MCMEEKAPWLTIRLAVIKSVNVTGTPAGEPQAANSAVIDKPPRLKFLYEKCARSWRSVCERDSRPCFADSTFFPSPSLGALANGHQALAVVLKSVSDGRRKDSP
jgi:hypothetical protein